MIVKTIMIVKIIMIGIMIVKMKFGIFKEIHTIQIYNYTKY